MCGKNLHRDRNYQMEAAGKTSKEPARHHKEKITSINCIMRTFRFNLPISTVIVEER